jgi:hypothetical protein
LQRFVVVLYILFANLLQFRVSKAHGFFVILYYKCNFFVNKKKHHGIHFVIVLRAENNLLLFF